MRATPETLKRADDELRLAYRSFSVPELRWDYTCNIGERNRQMIREEIVRRGLSMEDFERMGRGTRHI